METGTGPVTLVIIDANRRAFPETYQNIEAALQHASELLDNPSISEMFIAEERAAPPRPVILSPNQLRAECHRRGSLSF
jgi:hypothetical protein